MFDVTPAKILSLIDLTSLNDSDDESTIETLCKKAINHGDHVAAVCVYPRFVKQAVKFFMGKPVHVATVVNFPGGNDPLDTVLDSIRQSVDHGAAEIDVVFPYQLYLSGKKHEAYQFIYACREHCPKNILLKVILETGALLDSFQIEEVSRNVLLAGADFLKTSTGKIAVGATLDAAKIMLNAIKQMSPELNRPIGFKASGGIRTILQAKQYIDLAAQIMGYEWVIPQHFRLGASQLVDALSLPSLHGFA